jgi:hypothetical protein
LIAVPFGFSETRGFRRSGNDERETKIELCIARQVFELKDELNTQALKAERTLLKAELLKWGKRVE